MTGIVVDLFLIVRMPHGEAPEWVREAWIGCVLPAQNRTCGHVGEYTQGVVSRKPERNKIEGVAVDTGLALQVLAVHNEAAAQWFESQGYPREGEAFLFRTTDVRILAHQEPEPGTRLYYRCEHDHTWK